MKIAARLGAIDDWVFDLDNTLYPVTGPIWDALGGRMTEFVARATGLPPDEAYALQERYLIEYGATIAGMVKHHGVDPHEFLDYVHDVDVSAVAADAELVALVRALPGRKLVYTNGARAHADRILDRLGAHEAFDGIFALECADLYPKPARESFERLIARYAIDPKRALMVEDTPRNLTTAHELGFATVLLHPEPGGDFGDHVHHATDCLKGFLREALERRAAALI